MYKEKKQIGEVKVFIGKGRLSPGTDEDTFIDRFTILFIFSFGDRLVAGFTIAIQLFESFDRRLYSESLQPYHFPAFIGVTLRR